jgi:hypothetical protein
LLHRRLAYPVRFGPVRAQLELHAGSLRQA